VSGLRFAVMGTGVIARGLGPAIERCGAGRITHVASRDASRARAFARDPGLGAEGVTYEGLLDAEVDAVYLTLPNHLHVEWSIRLLEAGKHVLCEKPLTAWRDEAERAFAAAEAAGRRLVEAFLWPHHPHTRALAELAQGGERSRIGPLRLIRADRGHDLRGGVTVNTRWSHAMHGGALMDLGCYPLGLVRTLVGREPEGIAASARMAAPLAGETRAVDEAMALQLDFGSGGPLAQVACSMVSSEQRAATVLMGEWGTARTGWPYRPDPQRAVIRVVRNGLHPDGEGEEEVVVEGGGDVDENQFAGFARAIRGEAAPLPDPAWSIAQAGWIERALAGAGISFPRRSPTG
jgi:xylose dehydrogenase (NAD/NADP)